MLANARKTPSAARKEKRPLMAPESELEKYAGRTRVKIRFG